MAISRFLAGSVDHLAVHQQFTGGDVFQTRNHAQQGGFPTPGRADQHNKFAFVNAQRDPFNDADVAVGFTEII